MKLDSRKIFSNPFFISTEYRILCHVYTAFLKIDVETAQNPEIFILINVAEEIKLFVIPFSICKIALNLTSNFFRSKYFLSAFCFTTSDVDEQSN